MGKLTVNDRTSIIDDLINNTDWSEDDRETLEGLKDEQLKRIVANAVIADDKLTANEEEEEEDDFEVVDEAGDSGDEDDPDEDDDDEPVANRKVKTKVITNAFPPPKKKKKKMAGEEMKEATCNSAEEYLNRAPAAVRGALHDIIQTAKLEKRNLIKSLTANADCPWDKSELAGMENSVLRKLAKLAGGGRGTNYSGANAAEFSLTDNNVIEEAPIPRPTLDFSKAV